MSLLAEFSNGLFYTRNFFFSFGNRFIFLLFNIKKIGLNYKDNSKFFLHFWL